MTTPAEFRRIETLFNELVDLGAPERAARLQDLEDEEPNTAAAVRRLLARASATPNTDPLGESVQSLLQPALERDRIGPYRLLRVLGEGGMGVVWEAEQEEPLRRLVAIKLVRAGLGAPRLHQRFQSECRALARMSHRCIARVLDAGSTGDGRPFLVMEKVDGVPVTEFCDERALPVEARLDLFVAVCEAVHHAHQRGILHRDLKPSNVLVTTEEDEPVPKVIDFGIAKALLPDPGDPELTRFGELVGTPEYMSPEQRRGDEGDVDVRADVFALGVILHELLVGTRPAEDGTASARSRVTRGRRPASTHLAADEAAAEEVARRRTTTPGALRRLVTGDLDWILDRALAPDREDRYPSASELAADVRRFTRHEPITAGPPGPTYRLRRFVRRHRIGVAVATLFLLALFAGVVGTTSGMIRALRAEETAREAAAEARTAEARARREALTASQVTSFLVDLFRVADPGSSGGTQVTARELLDRGAARLRDELADQPLVRAELLGTVAAVYRNLGLYDDALELAEEALAIRRTELAPGDPEVAESLAMRGRIQRQRGDSAAAESDLRSALETLDRQPDRASDRADLRNDLALVLRVRDPEAALLLYREALDLSREVYGPEDEATAVLHANIASLEALAGRYEAARGEFQQALGVLERALGPDHPKVAGVLNNLAFVHRRLGQLESALELQGRDLAISLRALGPDHPTIGASRLNLARDLRGIGRLEEALDEGTEALRILTLSLPPTHRTAIIARYQLAETLLALGRLEEALTRAEEALDRIEELPSEERGTLTLEALLVAARAEYELGLVEAATARCRTALATPRRPRDDASRARLEALLVWSLARRDPAAARTAAVEARAALDAADPVLRPGESAFLEARTQALLGDQEAALDGLERAAAAGFRLSPSLGHADFSALRAAPRFQALLAAS